MGYSYSSRRIRTRLRRSSTVLMKVSTFCDVCDSSEGPKCHVLVLALSLCQKLVLLAVGLLASSNNDRGVPWGSIKRRRCRLLLFTCGCFLAAGFQGYLGSAPFGKLWQGMQNMWDHTCSKALHDLPHLNGPDLQNFMEGLSAFLMGRWSSGLQNWLPVGPPKVGAHISVALTSSNKRNQNSRGRLRTNKRLV